MKSVRIQSFSGPYFLAFGLNTERCEVSFRIQSESEKIQTRKPPNTDTFQAGYTLQNTANFGEVSSFCTKNFEKFSNAIAKVSLEKKIIKQQL